MPLPESWLASCNAWSRAGWRVPGRNCWLICLIKYSDFSEISWWRAAQHHFPTLSGILAQKESRKSGACNFHHIIFADPSSNPVLANDLPQCELANSFLTVTFLRYNYDRHRKLGTVPSWVSLRVRN